MKTLKAATIATILGTTAFAAAQATGTSHPEQVVITTSPEGISQPVLYTPTPALPAPVLKERVPAEAPLPAPAETRPVLTAAAALPPAEVAATPIEAIAPPASTDTPTPDIDAGVIMRVAGAANELPTGTLLYLRIAKPLNTRSTAEGTEWTASLTDAVLRDGHVLLPAGSVLNGRVSDVHGGRRISGAATMHLRPSNITLPDGTLYPVNAILIDSSLNGNTRVDREGTLIKRDHKKEAASILALTAGSGAAAGGLIAGVPGALIGAGVGAGLSAAVWLKQDRQAELPVGTTVVLELTSPMFIGGK